MNLVTMNIVIIGSKELMLQWDWSHQVPSAEANVVFPPSSSGETIGTGLPGGGLPACSGGVRRQTG